MIIKTDLLKQLLANHIEAYLSVSSFHWNVEGPDFKVFHSLFGEIYEDYQDQIDKLAEYVRIVSVSAEYVTASADIVKTNKTIKADLITGKDTQKMVSEINKINDTLISDFELLLVQANEAKQDGLANYCIDRLDVLNKLKWQLIAISK